MIIEVFVKGTNFQKHHGTFWNIKSILLDGGFFILVCDNPQQTLKFDAGTYELRVTY